jgi:hypothetical protein
MCDNDKKKQKHFFHVDVIHRVWGIKLKYFSNVLIHDNERTNERTNEYDYYDYGY